MAQKRACGDLARECPLSRVKRTFGSAAAMSANDPFRKSDCPICCDAQWAFGSYDVATLILAWRAAMKRREFMALVGFTAAGSLPMAAYAQQPTKLRTIGFLGVATASAWSDWVAAFVQRLRELGWIEGRTVAIEYRWADGRSERFAEIV